MFLLKRYLKCCCLLFLLTIISFKINIYAQGVNQEKAQATSKKGISVDFSDESKKIPLQILNTWDSIPYVQISDNEEFMNYISSVGIQEGAELISETERKKLNETLVKMCLAFSKEGEGEYFAFRTPDGPQWAISKDHIRAVVSTNSIDPKELIYTKLRSVLLKSASGRENSYKDFWVGVCFDKEILYKNLGIEKSVYIPKYGITIQKEEKFHTFYSDIYEPYQKSKQAKVQKNKSNKIKEEDRWPFYVHFNEPPLFEETPSMLDVYKENGYLLTVDVHFFVKRTEGRPPCPIIVRFYWNPEFQIWIPSDFASGFLEKILDFIGPGVKELF